MTAPTSSEIKQRYPAFASVPDATIQMAVGDALPWFDEIRWGDFYAQGVAAFVAHMLAQDQASAKSSSAGSAGPVAMKKVGDVQVQYAIPTFSKATDSFYASTPYGQRYLQLRRLVGLGAVAV